MALEIAFTVTESDDCLEWDVVDSTGNYNVTTTPGGYGAPNTASSAIVSVIINVLPYGETVPTIFTLTVATNVVTAATWTAPDGTVTNILADLAYTVFPFTEAAPFTIYGEWMGNGEDSELTAGAYNFEYIIATSGGALTYNTDIDQLITCQVCCCVRSAAVDLDATDCKCNKDKVDKAVRASIFLDSAIWAMENAEIEKSVNNLAMAKAICSGECKNC